MSGMIRIRQLFLLCAAIPCAAQVHVHIGAAVGVPLTDTLSSSSNSTANGVTNSFSAYHSVTKRLLAGPVLRVQFSRGFGVEFDALYQRVDYDYASYQFGPGSLVTRTSEATAANRWQFPLLVHYGRHHVFGEGGLSISHIGGSQSRVTVAGGTSSSGSGSGPGPTLTQAGAVAGGGVDLHLLHAHLRPQIRYTRWLASEATATGSGFTQFLGKGRLSRRRVFTTQPERVRARLARTGRSETNVSKPGAAGRCSSIGVPDNFPSPK